ncbi:MAG TPA: spore germination protein GerW family protein [Gemmatimonadales bacterium]|nr:spore germination protein GerW family protein [Gemmatimonadales bacterium]
MSTQELLRSLGESMKGSASVSRVYGEPVQADGRTVIPVARVRYGFGGGEGERPAGAATEGEEHHGAGGGGGIAISPVGLVEVTEKGTRFIRFGQTARLLAAGAAGFTLGALGMRQLTRLTRSGWARRCGR